MKGNVARMPDIAVFSDELRDGLSLIHISGGYQVYALGAYG